MSNSESGDHGLGHPGDHAGPVATISGPVLAPGARAAALARARLLNRLTLGWNVLEGVVALTAGLAAGSISLVGFGIDSGIEVSAAAALAWRLGRERRGGCMADYDRRANRLIALAFIALAAYVWGQAASDLATRARPEASLPGLGIALASLFLMPRLARAKRALAPALGSRAAASEAEQTRICALLSGVVVAGVGLNALLSWWWADPVAAFVIGALAGAAGLRAWRAESLADTCCD